MAAARLVVMIVPLEEDEVEDAEDGLEGSGEVCAVLLVERGDRGDWTAREDGDLSAATALGFGDSMLAVLRDGESREDADGLGDAGML